MTESKTYAVLHLSDGTAVPMFRPDAFQQLIRERLGDEAEAYYLEQLQHPEGRSWIKPIA